MTRRRWIADEVSGNHAALTGDHANRLIHVLRARTGQEFDIATGTTVRCGRITTIAENRVEFELGEELPSAPPASLTLLLSIFKFDRMEWAIEKCTELGVSRIIPLIARRTDAHLVSASAKRAERWRRIALQAAEQSRRALPPEIFDPVKFQDALAMPAALRVVLAESDHKVTLLDAVYSVEGDIILAIGPEGGWTDEELHSFRAEGWVAASLGHTILRAETAAISATAITVAQLAGHAASQYPAGEDPR